METTPSQVIPVTTLSPVVSDIKLAYYIAADPARKTVMPAPYNVRAINNGETMTVYATIVVPPNSLPHIPPYDDRFSVTQVFSVDSEGLPKLLFYLCYTDDYATGLAETNYCFVADSKTFPSGFLLEDIVSVEVFLWDKDPKTSRGTVTTVIHATPNPMPSDTTTR